MVSGTEDSAVPRADHHPQTHCPETGPLLVWLGKTLNNRGEGHDEGGLARKPNFQVRLEWCFLLVQAPNGATIR